MRPLDVLDYAFSDYATNKFKTLMSSLGIIIGVAAIIAIMSLGNGLYNGVSQQYGSANASIFAVMPMKIGIGLSDAKINPPAQLTDQDVNAILNISGVASVHPEISVVTDTSFNNINSSVTAMAIIPTDEQRLVPDIAAGRFLNDSDTYSVVLGNTTASNTFGRQINPGDYITLTNNKTGQSHAYLVVGMLNKRNLSVMLGDSDSIIYMTKAGLTGLSDQTTYSEIGVTTTSASQADTVAQNINTTLAPFHTHETYSVDTQSTQTNLINRIFELLACIAAVSLLVSGIGIMNVMMLTVRERVKDIGLMKAIGFTTTDIRIIFLTESALLGIISGLIGVVIAEIIIALVSHLFGMSMGISLQNMIIGVGFGLVVTILFGVYPANQAAKMDPVEALRTE